VLIQSREVRERLPCRANSHADELKWAKDGDLGKSYAGPPSPPSVSGEPSSRPLAGRYQGGGFLHSQRAGAYYRRVAGVLASSIDLCLACAAGLCRLATGHLLQLFGVPGALHRDLRGGAVDLMEIAGREFD
jgi:hypothetical protein